MGPDASTALWRHWFAAGWPEVALVLASTFSIYAVVILFTRFAGLRSFSKMSASDFAMTVAVGSLLGSSVAQSPPPVLLSVVALGGLFAGQWLIAWARTRSARIAAAVDNRPVLLVVDGRQLRHNMRACRVSEGDLRAKLRQAAISSLDDVAAVVFETTGDVSIIPRRAAGGPVDARIFADVVDGALVLETAGSARGDDVDRVDDAGNVAEQRQHDVDPELQADADLEKHAERRQQDR